MAVVLTGTANACGYHGPLGDGFSAMHARSIEVAVAMREALDAGRLAEQGAAPARADLVAFHRVSKRLERLRVELAHLQSAGETVPAFALLLVEPGLWSRFVAAGGTIGLAIDSAAPAEGEATVVTGEAVINAMVTGTMTGGEAITRGLIVIEGAPADRARLASILTTALAALKSGT